MKARFNVRRLIHWLMNPRAIIFAVCLGNFILRGVEIDRLDRKMRAYGYVVHSNPGQMMVEPFLLLFGGIMLLINRWWSLLLALLAATRVIYSLGYLSWTAVHYAHDVPMLSWQAMEKLWYVIYQPRPQYLFEVVLGLVILVYSAAVLSRVAISRSAVPVVGG